MTQPRTTNPSPSRQAHEAQAARTRREQLDAILDKLDARDAASDGKTGRRSMRASYRRSDVSISVYHPGGSTTERRVLTRDLSAGGLSFVNSGYLHVGTRCETSLRRFVGGGEDLVRGQVMHCDHIAGTWHTVGVKFDRRIFPKLYLDPGDVEGVNMEGCQPSGISGRVLLLDDNELDRRLVAHHLRRTKIELTGVATLADAAAAVAGQQGDNPFQLAIVDLNLAGEEAELGPAEVVRRLIDVGVPRVAACTAETDTARLRECREAGARGILTKPYDAERLLASVAEWLGVGSSGSTDAITSTLATQADMLPLLQDFVEKAKKLSQAIKQSAEADDLQRVRSLLLGLRGSGGGYGFQPASEAATEAIKSLEATMSLSDSAVQLDRVHDVCGRLTAEADEADASDQSDPPAMAA